MLAQPDEASRIGEILHKIGMECVDKSSVDGAFCFHTFKVEKKASGDGYIGPPNNECQE